MRWCVTAGIVSLPFVYMSLGLSFPDTLISGINEILFYVNKDYKERLYRHEAGHFLVGYLSGLPVLRYSVGGGRMNAVQFAQVFDDVKRMETGSRSMMMVRSMII